MKVTKFRLVAISVAVCLGMAVFAVFHSEGNELASAAKERDVLEFAAPICIRPPQLELASLAAAGEMSIFRSEARPPIDAPSAKKNLAPLRTIWEPGPNFSGVFVDVANDEIVAIDNNHNQVLIYARLANGMTPPRRTIRGPASKVEFPSSVFVDNVHDEVYVLDNEVSDHVTVHKRTTHGNVPPVRTINVRLTTSDKRYSDGIMHYYGIWGDPKANEIVATAQVGSNISTWDMNDTTMSGIPKRNIQGKNTGLANPLGVSIDTANGEIVAVNNGHLSGGDVAPSIRFFKRDADGDVAPLRVIEGPLTKLEYSPKGMYLDTVNDEIYVATTNDAILVFPRTGSGNIAPTRILSGASTGLDHPTGVFVDTVHNEMVVSNWQNFSITVYPRTANGDVRPIRTIRASADAHAVGLLRGRGTTFDRVNDEMWHLN